MLTAAAAAIPPIARNEQGMAPSATWHVCLSASRYETVDSKKASVSTSHDLAESVAKHVLVLDSSLQDQTASRLRGVFIDRFSDPRHGKPERFVWDWWHVPDQYTLVRNKAVTGGLESLSCDGKSCVRR